VTCTHTLEDVRDPEIAIREMQRIGKSGFISVPNRHTELSNLRKYKPFASLGRGAATTERTSWSDARPGV